MNSGEYLIITLLSFTLPCISNSFLLQTPPQSQPIAAEMLARSPEQQHRLGYFHTLREICRQPSRWVRTGELIRQSAPGLSQLIEGISSLTFSGSASSDYAGDGVRMVLQRELDLNTRAIPGGRLLDARQRCSRRRQTRIDGVAGRSGDSPESVDALSLMCSEEWAALLAFVYSFFFISYSLFTFSIQCDKSSAIETHRNFWGGSL